MDISQDIAIIGLSGRFPQSHSIEEFWQHLCQGKELITFFTEQELQTTGIPSHVLNNEHYIKAKGYIKETDYFDAHLFGFHSREATYLDPQQRIFLECSWEALEDAGYDPEQYEGLIGVFASCSFSSYLIWYLLPALAQHPQDEMIMVMGNEKDFLATRVSYKLNLKGPSKTIQTACSSSLVAVHDACQSLLNYECDIALAGGVSITFPEKNGYYFVKEGINSPDGHCRAFDAQAEGTVMGNGAGVVVLKRLEDALKDRDSIYAVIKGSAVNNDGSHKVGFTAPSVEGQAKVIAMALANAQVSPDSISYIETHGTGTLLGDPIELAGLTKAFQEHTQKEQFCAIGSVKTNIGHLDTAAGIAGLIKVALALKHKKIPASINFNKPNPKINFTHTPFYVNTGLCEWQPAQTPRRAGVSSFGMGGTNAHVILEENVQQVCETGCDRREYVLIPFSARSDYSLKGYLEKFAHYVTQTTLPLQDIAYTLQLGRKQLEQRAFIVCRKSCDRFALKKAIEETRLSLKMEPRISCTAVFGCYFSKDLLLIKEVYQQEFLFQKHFNQCAKIIYELTGHDIGPSVLITVPHIVSLSSFAVQYAFAQWLQEFGVVFDCLIGIGVGQLIAAVIGNYCSLEKGVALLWHCLGQRGLEIVNCQNQTNSREVQIIPLFTEECELLTESMINDPSYWIALLSSTKGTQNTKVQVNEQKSTLLIYLTPRSTEGNSSTEEICIVPETEAYSLAFHVLEIVGRLWAQGLSINWQKVQEGNSCRRVSAPSYCFQRRSYWSDHQPGFLSQASSIEVKAEAEAIFDTMQATDKAPQDKIEALLVQLWQMAFKTAPIHCHDHYFQLGGDSLLAIELIVMVKKELAIDLTIANFFEFPTIAQQAELIRNKIASNIDCLDEVQAEKLLALLS